MIAPASLLTLVLGAELELRLLAPESVEFGRPFELIVERRWREGWSPEAWSDARLEPLVVASSVVERGADEDGAWERRRLSCRLLVLDAVELGPVLARAHDQGRVIEARSNVLEIAVEPGVDPENPGAAELPDELLLPPPVPVPWLSLGLSLGAIVVAVLGGLAWRRRSARRETLGVLDRLRPRLEALRAASLDEAPDRRAAAAEAAELLRWYLHHRPLAPALFLSTEELRERSVLRGDEDGESSPGLRVLHRGDRVKYGRGSPEADEVRETTRLLELAVQRAEEWSRPRPAAEEPSS